jgi:hypothetical protein
LPSNIKKVVIFCMSLFYLSRRLDFRCQMLDVSKKPDTGVHLTSRIQ